MLLQVPQTAVVLFATLLLCACAGSAHRLPDVTDAELRQTQEEIVRSHAPLKTYDRSDATYRKMVSRITNRLLENAQPLCQHTGYEKCFFQTVYSAKDDLNAFASDGYKITAYRGLLQYLESEDEIAALIAHEMGHHLARHNEEKTDNANVGAAAAGILTAVLIGAANANNPYYDSYQQQQGAETIDNMMAIGAEIGSLSYSKEEEREADLLGAYLLARAGYDLHKAERIMVVLVDLPGNEGETRAGLTDTHPMGIERLAAWRKTIAEIDSNPSKLPYATDTASK